MKQAYNKTQRHLMVPNLKVANTFVGRLKGLMGTTLQEGEGLQIQPCNSIHTFWMKTAIDVIFVDKNHSVLKVILNMERGKMSPMVKGSKYVIEALPGAFDHVNIGDRVGIDDKPEVKAETSSHAKTL